MTQLKLSQMKGYVISCLAGILILATQPIHGQIQSMSLEEAQSYAISHSFAIKNAQASMADAEWQIKERISTGLPQINGSATYQRYLETPQQPLPQSFIDLFTTLGVPLEDGLSFLQTNNLTFSATVDQLIFDGSYFVGLEAARAYRTFEAKNYLVEERKVKNGVTDAFLPVLLLQENLDILNKNIENLDRMLFETKALYDEGFAEQLDVDRLTLSKANLETQKNNLIKQKEVSLAVLKMNMNYPMTEELVVTGDFNTLMAAENQSMVVESTFDPNARPEVLQSDQGIRLNELNLKLTKSQYLPSLRAFGAYQYAYQGNDNEDGFWSPTAYVGLSLNVPIFDGLYKKATSQRRKLDILKAQNQRMELINALKVEVQNARTAYEAALANKESTFDNLKLAERIYETTQIKYREGVGSSIELTQAEQSLYTSQSNYMNALYELTDAFFKYKRALGK